MDCVKGRLPPLLIILFFLIASPVAVMLALQAPSENLVTGDKIERSHGVLREQRLLDGRLPAPGHEVNDFVAALFLAKDAFIRIDFEEVVSFEYLQLNSLGKLGVWTSGDGTKWDPLPLRPLEGDPAIRVHMAGDTIKARYVTLALQDGAVRAAGLELTVLPKAPEEVPIAYPVQDPPTYYQAVDEELARLSTLRFVKIAIALAFAVALLFIRRWAVLQLSIYSLFFLLALCVWFRVGNPLQNLHTWEATHYFLGAKYYEELGHTELYNELARHEVRSGRGQLFTSQSIRDLETNEVHPGQIVLTPEFNRDSSFSSERLGEFSRDADRVRRQFQYRHFSKVVEDHGYNAAPLFTTLFSRLLQSMTPSRGTLTGFALLDILFILGGLAVLWLGFGARCACLAATVLCLAEPWSFEWTGASIGRFLWFFLLCGGLALLKRNRRFAGAFAMCLAGMLRLFPLVFLAGIGGIALYRLVRREEPRSQIHLLSGIAAGLLLGLILPLLFHPGIYSEFFANIKLHAQNVSVNRMGFGALLDAWFPGRPAIVNWLSYGIGAAGCFALCWRIVSMRLELWHAFVAAAFLLYFLTPLSSYDYVWVVCLAPACLSSQFRTFLVVGMLVAFNLFTEFPFGQDTHTVMNMVTFVAFGLFFGSYAMDLFRRSSQLELDETMAKND
jgi:hypothetical protein